MDGGVDASALEPRTERELVALLYPESALLFAWARRALRDIAGEQADRFLVGRVEPGCWSVTHARKRWLTVHDGGQVEFDSARSAVAYAMAGVMLDAGVSVNSALLELGGIITRGRSASGRSLWVLGETGRRLTERPREEAASRPGFRRSCVRLSALDGRPFFYFVCALEPPPDDAAFATAHEVFELAAYAMLPGDFGVSKGEKLPEGTVLDGYGGQDDVFLFTPEAPFSKRGLWGGPHQHTRKVYRMQRPLLVYPGFPVERETSSGTKRRGESAEGGRGYYLVDSIADLIRSGHLVEISAENRMGGVTMALTEEEGEARLQEIAERLVSILPDGWERASLRYQALGSFEVGGLRCRGEAGDEWATGRKLPQTDIYDLLRALRRDMYAPETGTFVFLSLAVYAKPDGGFDWGNDLGGADRFTWEDHVSAADCALQMRMFPAPDHLIPDWMRRRAELHRVAEAFEPREILARPQTESDLVALLPESIADIFAKARLRLEEVVPGGAARLRIGRLDEGCWSVVHAGSGWLAVGFAEDGQARATAFGDVRSALAHAMAQIMAEEKVEINSELLEDARVLGRQRRPRVNEDAWHVDEPGGEIVRRTFHSPRPTGDAARDESYIALDPLNNRPGGYFVCRPGPPPETGPYVSVREVLEMLATRRLPKPPAPGRRRPEPPTEVLPVGTEVDAYEHHDQCFVFAIGTPQDRRGWFDSSKEPRYHVYRVAKPLKVYPGLFAPLRLPGDEPPGERPGGEGQGYYLVDSIEDFVRSGHLVEIDRPGGDPVRANG